MSKAQTSQKKNSVRHKAVKRRGVSSAVEKKKSSARRPSARRKACGKPAPVTPTDSTAVYRARMQLVGGLLNSAFERVMSPLDDRRGGEHAPASNNPVQRVGQGAYLQIMGQVFAAMFDLSQAIPIDELVKLSRIVAEQRRAESGARKAESAAGPGSKRASAKIPAHALDTFNGHRELPESFGDMVRQIYGVSVTDSAACRNACDRAAPRLCLKTLDYADSSM